MNGVSQSNHPPAYCRSTTLIPCSNPPSVSPWHSAASNEPPKNATSHNRRPSGECARNRSSNATPRKISPNSIPRIVGYSAGRITA